MDTYLEIKKRIRIGLLLSLFSLVTFNLSAQTNQSSLLHFDKDFYVSGETMHYRLFLPIALQKDSLCIRVSVHDAEGDEFDYFFLQKLGDTDYLEGYYQLPYKLSSSWYQFLFITIDANSGRLWRMARAVLAVYNDLRPPSNLQEQTSHPIASVMQQNDLQVTITPDPATLTEGGTIEADIQVVDASGQAVEAVFSTTVTDWDLLENDRSIHDGIYLGDPLPNQFASANLIFEIGYVKDDLGDPLETKLLSAYDPLHDEFIYTESTAQGLFALDVPPFYGSKSVQFMDFIAPEIQIDLSKMTAEKIDTPLPFTPSIKRYCEWSRLRKKIYQLYRSVENPLVIAPPQREVLPLRPGQELSMEDYVSFPDLGTFFKEVNTPLKIRKRKKEFYAQMFNPATQDDFVNNPLFRIGDKLTQNANFVAQIPMSDIEKIQLFFDFKALSERYLLHGRDGLVIIHPYAGDLEIPESDADDIFQIHGLQAPPIMPEKDEALPSIRPQVYWNPQQTSSPTGKSSIRFSHTDDQSRFRIQVVAQSRDGRRGVGVAEYVIKGNQ